MSFSIALSRFCLGKQRLEPGVLCLEFSQPLGSRNFHSAVLRLPAIEAMLRHPVPTDQIRYRGACFVFLEDAYDLFIGIALSLYVATSQLSILREISHSTWPPWGGGRSTNKVRKEPYTALQSTTRS